MFNRLKNPGWTSKNSLTNQFYLTKIEKRNNVRHTVENSPYSRSDVC